jgi:hypothetical protein
VTEWLRTRAAKVASVVTALALMNAGCLPHVDEEHVHTARAVGNARTHRQHREQDEITASASGDSVHVLAQERWECDIETSTPTEEVDGTRRSLQNGTLAQVANVAMAGLLVAGGIAVYAAANSASCTSTPNATTDNPNPSAVPCTSEQQQTQTAQTRGLGIITAGVAILPLGAFVWNLIRAKDDVEASRAPNQIADSEWTPCGVRPLANISITLAAGGVTIDGLTNERGEATLDVSLIATASSDPKDASVTVDSQTGKGGSASVSLLSAPAYLAWRQATDAAQAHRDREANIEQVQRQTEDAQRQAQAQREREQEAARQREAEMARRGQLAQMARACKAGDRAMCQQFQAVYWECTRPCRVNMGVCSNRCTDEMRHPEHEECGEDCDTAEAQCQSLCP